MRNHCRTGACCLQLLIVIISGGCRAARVDRSQAQGAQSTPTVDPRVQGLISDLRSPNAITRSTAAERLAGLGPKAEPAMDALIVALADSDDDVCIWAVRAICGIGPAATRAVPAMLHMATVTADTDRQCWGVPEIEVGKIGRTAIPQILDALDGPDAKSAASLLVALGPVAVDDLSTVIRNGGRRAIAATDVINRMSISGEPAAANAAPALISALRTSDPQLRTAVILALGELGPAAKDAVGQLESLKRQPGANVNLIDRALAKIRG